MKNMRGNFKIISDENVPEKVNELLKEEGFNVKKVPLGVSDKEISRIAKLESRAILTFDKHFLNKEKFPPKEYYGIVFISIIRPMIDTVFFSLMRLLNNIKYSELIGKLFIVTEFGYRQK